jgi:HK97 family phage major capsid protein
MEEDIKKVHQAIADLRKEIEKENPNNEKIKKLNDFLDTQEKSNQTMTAKITAQENEAKELKDQIAVLDKNICRISSGPGAHKDAYKETPEYKALSAFCKQGLAMMSEEHKTNLRTDDNNQGGYLVHDQMASLILKEIEEISPVRQFARKWSTKTKSLIIPVRSSIPTAAYEKELEAGGQSKSNYRSETLTGFRQQAIIGATQDIISFANFAIESEIITDAKLSFATAEGNKFLLGTGVKEPEGILVNANIVTTDTTEAVAGPVTGAGLFDDVINMIGRLKIGYNPIYFFNRTTLAFLRTAKSTAGGYLWEVGGTNMPNQIVGFNYAIFQDMPSISDGAGAKILGFGDLFAGYSILDSIQMSLIRDNITQAGKALILFYLNRWNTGQVVIPEAIKLLKVKA